MSDSQLQEAVLAQAETDSGPAASSPAPVPDQTPVAAPVVEEAGNENSDVLMADAPAANEQPSPALPAAQSPALAAAQSPALAAAQSPALAAAQSPALAAAQSPALPAQSPAPAVQPPASAVASPAPARTGTPVRTNGVHDKEPGSSRANSVLPEQREPLPDRAAAHGEPARKYLNTKVAEHLLAGMKKLAKEQPNDPLRVLGEFLLARHQELEHAGNL